MELCPQKLNNRQSFLPLFSSNYLNHKIYLKLHAAQNDCRAIRENTVIDLN